VSILRWNRGYPIETMLLAQLRHLAQPLALAAVNRNAEVAKIAEANHWFTPYDDRGKLARPDNLPNVIVSRGEIVGGGRQIDELVCRRNGEWFIEPDSVEQTS
jgi:hypothetical protein